MKKIFCLAFCLLAVLSSLTVAAKKAPYSISLGEGYTTAYSDGTKKELSQIVGMSEQELEEYFSENNILMLAANSDNSSQIHLSCIQNEFSELVGDISQMSDGDINELAATLAGGALEYKLFCENGGEKYIVFTSRNNDSGGDYTVTQFCTVLGGKMYQLSFYESGITVGDAIYEVVNSFTVNAPEKGSTPVLLTLLFVLGIAVFASLAVIALIGIIKRLRTSPEE